MTELEKICTEDLASEVEHQALFNTVTDLEKRVENLEKALVNYVIEDKEIEK